METVPPRPSYASHLEFYEAVYGSFVQEAYVASRVNLALFSAVQSAGDWSDKATPDLVVARLASKPVHISVDVGAGRFAGQQASGAFIVVPPHVDTSIQVAGHHVCECIALPYGALRAFAGDDLLREDGDLGVLHARLNADRQLGAAWDGLWRDARSPDGQGTLRSDAMVLQIVDRLLCLAAARSFPTKGGLAPWQVRRATEYLEDHLSQSVSLLEVATEARLSPFHFQRAFKQTLGVTPARWLLERRIERAVALLGDPTWSLVDIALEVGFASQGSFGAAFKRVIGRTPADYRRDVLR